MLNSRALPSSKNNPCPVCGNTSGDCRTLADETIFCFGESSAKKGDVVNGFICVKGANGHTATFKPDNREEWTEERRQEWEQQKLARQRAAEEERRRRIEGELPAVERDKYYRQILGQLKLSDEDRANLEARGFTTEQIERDGYKSVVPWQPVNRHLPEWQRVNFPFNLPGLLPHHRLNIHAAGILCPVFNQDGLIVALQVRLHQSVDGRYRWLTSATQKNPEGATPHLNGELPIGIYEPVEESQTETIWLTEGTSIKPSLARHRLDTVTVGASSGRFTSSPETSKAAVAYLAGKYQTKILTFAIDAGDIINQSGVPARWEEQYQFFSDLGYSCQFGWWGQVTKEACDIDELTDFSSIGFIGLEEFKGLVKSQGEEFNTPSQEPKQSELAPKDEPTKPSNHDDKKWDLWRKSRKFTPDLKQSSQYFDFAVPEPGTILAIKSGTGTGKTHWLIEKLLKEYKDRGFLSLGYRNSLLIQFCSLLNDWYHLQQDLKGTQDEILLRDLRSKIAGCLDSLLYFKPQDFNERILILDEIESIIDHLFHSNTSIAQHRQLIKELFKEALNRASLVVLLDGHLKDRTVQFIQDLMNKPKKLIKVENEYKGNKGKVKFIVGAKGDDGKIRVDDYSTIAEAIKNNSNNFAVVSDSQTKIEALDNILKAQCRKTFRFDSTTSSTPEAKKFLANPEKYIRENQIEVILYTPSAEAGLNIDIKGYFNDIYVLFFGVVATDAQLQMIARIRDPEAVMWLFCKTLGLSSDAVYKNASCPEELAKLMSEYAMKCAESSLSGTPQPELLLELATKIIARSNTPLFQVDCELTWIDDFERKHLRECLKEGLIESGYDLEDVVASRFSIADVRAACDEVQNFKSGKIAKSDDIDSTEAQKIASDIGATQEDKFKLAKFRLLEKLPGIETATYPITIDDPPPGEPPIVTPELKPIFDAEFVKRVLFGDRRLITKIELRWLLENPEVAKELQQIRWHRNLSIFTDPEKPAGEGLLNLAGYRSQWLKIQSLKKMGIDFFLQPGAEWTGETPEVLEFFKQAKEHEKYTRYIVGNSNPCQFVGIVLKSLGINTESSTDRKLRTYRIKADDPMATAIYEAVGKRLMTKLIESRPTVNWELILNPSQAAETQAQQVTQPAHTLGNSYINSERCALNSSESLSQIEVINPTLPPDIHQAINILKTVGSWAEVTIPQEVLNAAWEYLPEERKAVLCQMAKAEEAIASQRTIFEVGFGIGGHFRSYIVKAVKDGIALVRKCWGDKEDTEIDLNRLLFT